MGYSEEEVTDRRRTYRGLFSVPGSYSVGTREMERPTLSEGEVRLLKRGRWYLRRVKNGNDQPPILVKAGRAPKPVAEFDPERVVAEEPPETDRAEPTGEGVVART
jgi:hypothetical protein